MMRSFLCALAAITLGGAPAAAQDQRVFVNVNFGALTQKQDLKQTATLPLYAAMSRNMGGRPHDRRRTVFRHGAGYRVSRNFFVGVSYTQVNKDTRDVTVNASVPSPVFTDTFRNASGTATGLERKERAFHLQALWQIPVTVEFGMTALRRSDVLYRRRRTRQRIFAG